MPQDQLVIPMRSIASVFGSRVLPPENQYLSQYCGIVRWGAEIRPLAKQ